MQEEKTLTLERQAKLEEAAAKERQEALDVYNHSLTHSFTHSFIHSLIFYLLFLDNVQAANV